MAIAMAEKAEVARDTQNKEAAHQTSKWRELARKAIAATKEVNKLNEKQMEAPKVEADKVKEADERKTKRVHFKNPPMSEDQQSRPPVAQEMLALRDILRKSIKMEKEQKENLQHALAKMACL